MSTLIIELEGPMQSWGYRSRFGERDTGREPSKSGVLGIVAASLGRIRDKDLTDLASLRFGVRADREGNIKKEFQTALNVIKATGKSPDTQITNRYYLADARFIAALEGDADFLSEIKDAIENPVFSQFLGRKSYLASVPFINTQCDYLTSADLETALSLYPYIQNRKTKEIHGLKLRVVRDAREDEESPSQDFRQDVPVSFGKKEYLVRKVITEWITAPVKGA
ncbi:MAG: hypothetical protein FMNOHCHN_02522 [Ignavibacteriaceae bacterium]|nr:hypothetical protein [Ignavibacteriaceae bacterium]